MKYKVKIGWAGYSRGSSVYEVEADSEEEAIENWWIGEKISNVVVRDDTEVDDGNIIILNDLQGTGE